MAKVTLDSDTATCYIQFDIPFVRWYYSWCTTWAAFKDCAIYKIWLWICTIPFLGKCITAPGRFLSFLTRTSIFYTKFMWEGSKVAPLPNNVRAKPTTHESIRRLEKELDESWAKVEELLLQLQEKDREIDTLKVDSARKDEIIIGLQNGVASNNKKNMQIEADLSNRNAEIQSKGKRIKRLETELDIKSKDMKELDGKLKAATLALQTKAEETSEVTKAMSELKLVIESQAADNKSKEKKLKHLESEVESKKGVIQQLEASNGNKNADIKAKNKRIKSLEDEVQVLNSQNKEVQAHLQAFKSRSSASQYDVASENGATANGSSRGLPVYLAVADGNFGDAEKQLLVKVQQKLASNQVNSSVKLWHAGQTVEDGALPVIVCLYSSRLATDIETAVRKVDFGGDRRVALIVMHHKPKHQSKVSPTSSLLDTVFFERHKVAAVTDGVFWDTDGFYDCKQNTQLLSDLVRFIKTQTVNSQ